MDIVTFILGGSAVATLLVALIKRLVKKITKVEYQTLGSLVILFVVSCIFAGISFGFNFLSSEVQAAIASVFVCAIAVYDVLKKAVFEGLVVKYLA